MKCSSCYKDIEYDLTPIHKEFLSLFIDDESELTKYKDTSDLYENERSTYLSRSIFKKAINEPDYLLDKIKTMDLPQFSRKCIYCGCETKEYFYNYHLYNIYNELQRNLNDYIYLKISDISGIKYQEVFELHENDNGDTSGYWAGIKTLSKVDPELAKKVEKTNEVIERFHYSGEKGGDGDNSLLFFIFGFIASSIIPNLIYDLTKSGSLKLIELIKRNIRTRKYAVETEKATTKYYPDLFDEYSNDSVLKYLSKKQRRKIVKKIIKKQIKMKSNKVTNRRKKT